MALTHTVTAIGTVTSPRTEPIDDDWGAIESTIELDDDQFTADVVAGLDDFSHIEVLFVFDQVAPDKINLGARHPRNRQDWPLVGIFAQRAKARPHVVEFGPRGEVRQPEWIGELMRGYWSQ